jgi:NAD+ synthase
VIPENIMTRADGGARETRPTRIAAALRHPGCDPRTAGRARGADRQIVAGFERETVMKVARMLDIAEYKRRQAAPGVKVTLKNFGRDRRYPIVNRFRDTASVVRARPRAAAAAGSPRAKRSISA